MTSESPIVE